MAFFPLARRRLLRKALDKLRDLEAKALAVAEQRLERPELEAEMAAALKELGASSGSSLAASRSIPDPRRCGSSC